MQLFAHPALEQVESILSPDDPEVHPACIDAPSGVAHPTSSPGTSSGGCCRSADPMSAASAPGGPETE